MARRSPWLLIALAVLAAACAVGPGDARPASSLRDDAVTIGSFNFPESVLLAEIYAQALEAQGIRVDRRFDLGPRELVEPALQRGLLELVPEYTGSLLQFLVGGVPSSRLEAVRADLAAALERRGLALLASAPAQNRNGFAVTRSFARATRTGAISQLADQPDLVLGGPPECAVRPLCLPGLEGAYGLTFAEFVPLDQSGPLTADALERGVVDVALLFTSSAELEHHDLVLLEDDRHLQPAEHVTPVVHREALERFGARLSETVDGVSARLTTAQLRALNAQVVFDGRAAAVVAREWLTANGLLEAQG